MERYLNIIAFNIPWPANYGGIIDVYYKIKALHQCGVKIILHCFEYERAHSPELEAICEKVFYYKRHTGLRTNITLLPYNVYSRKHPELIANLLKNDYPILFEGLHCCYYINDPRLHNRKKIYREANIEHDYYYHLAQAESHPIRKSFFRIEAWRFKHYQKILKHADLMIAVSTTDADYLRHQFPDKPVEFMPCFHTNNQITVKPGSSDFILYHGKLSVIENTQAALFLIRNVFSKLESAGFFVESGSSLSEYPYRSQSVRRTDERLDTQCTNTCLDYFSGNRIETKTTEQPVCRTPYSGQPTDDSR